MNVNFIDRKPGMRDSRLRPMHNLSRSHSAVFRVISRSLRDSTPEDCADDQHGVIQERLIIPLNGIMGRYQLGQASAGLCLRAPGVGRECFYEKQLDYFDRECSKRHCVIELDDQGQTRIRDLSSTNGTWLWRAPRAGRQKLGQWEELQVGVSYPLELHQRIQIGDRSDFEYEFLGLTENAQIRIRYCAKNNDAIVHEHDWEWIPLSPNGKPWHTSELKDAKGQPLHGAPHFSVRIHQRDCGSYLAEIEYDSYQGKRAPGYTQETGSKVYGAELVEHDEYGDSELYQVGYELLLPGNSGFETVGHGGPSTDTPHFFLRSQFLVMRALVDEEGWTTKASLHFSEYLTSQRHSTAITFYRTSAKDDANNRLSKDELSPGQYYSEKPKSIRQAIVCALVERRLRDQSTRAQDPGWLTRDDIIGLTKFKELSQKDFSNNASKWRSDIAKFLETNAIEFQRSLNKLVAIPEEQDWKSFVEFKGTPQDLSLRLHPGIRVEATRDI